MEPGYEDHVGVSRLGVVGAGRMGAGIAQVAAQAGLHVLVSDVSEERLSAGRSAVERSLARPVPLPAGSRPRAEETRLGDPVEKGAAPEAGVPATLDRIHWTTRLEEHADRELVIEAVTEDEAVKVAVFRALDRQCGPAALFASNTSSISITRLGAASGRPDRLIGMHFMNPVPLMPLVEVIRGAATSDATYEATLALARRLGKQTTLARDYPGFIANRILMPMVNEAFFALLEGVGSAEDIDRTLTLGAHHPSGPLRLADHIGLDVCLAILEVLHSELGDPKYRPCPLLRQYVAAGWLGRKSGRGIYRYEEGARG